MILKIHHFLFLLIFSAFLGNAQPAKVDYSQYVHPFIGAINNGSCMPGPCLPHSSVYPSPNTIKGHNGGYAVNEKITGFAQLHTQGSGGLKSYGNFLVSPQIGLRISEAEHQSNKEEEQTSASFYKVKLKNYGILCELSPSNNASLYKFTYPASDSAIVLIDVARKNGATIGLGNGNVQITPDRKAIYGVGTYGNNWPDAKHKWDMFFYAEFSEPAHFSGVFSDFKILSEQGFASAAKKNLGAYLGFQTKLNQEIYVKIAVSFISPEHARSLLQNEIPEWDLGLLNQKAKATWNDYLSRIQIESGEEEKNIFYTHLFHSFVQPRNRTGNNSWKTDEEFWDDHYTMWDSWKTLFPLMCIVDQEMVASTIRSFINRHKHNGYVAEAFVNGKESPVGQGGNTVDNIIGDAYVKNIPGIDWEKAYSILKYNADSMRTPAYRDRGFMHQNEPTGYSWRLKPGSATIAFAFNDFCLANMAKGLGKSNDYELYGKRSASWKNIWNPDAVSDGFSGFIMARKSNGDFDKIDPKTGYNQHFYEGTCWEYSYEIPHDVQAMVDLMGGKKKFIERLKYAMDNHLIDFGNEPSFMTPWLFSHESVQRPDLTSYYIRTKLLPLFTRYDLPGDDDQGAMASLYIFAKLGFFPFAGTDKYYLHGGSYSKATIKLPANKTFTIKSLNASPENIYIRSVKLNNQKLNRSWITHSEIMNGGILEFDMTSAPINFTK